MLLIAWEFLTHQYLEFLLSGKKNIGKNKQFCEWKHPGDKMGQRKMDRLVQAARKDILVSRKASHHVQNIER